MPRVVWNEWIALNELPRAVRDALNDASCKIDARSVAVKLAEGYTTEQVIEAIKEMRPE